MVFDSICFKLLCQVLSWPNFAEHENSIHNEPHQIHFSLPKIYISTEIDIKWFHLGITKIFHQLKSENEFEKQYTTWGFTKDLLFSIVCSGSQSRYKTLSPSDALIMLFLIFLFGHVHIDLPSGSLVPKTNIGDFNFEKKEAKIVWLSKAQE